MAPVHDAAERGDIEALAAMAREDHGLLRLRDPFDRTPLLWAARRGQASAVAWLLDHAAAGTTSSSSTSTDTTSPEASVVEAAAAKAMAADADHFGNAALHVAAREGHVESVAVLLARGADPRARNRYGWTALIAASVNGRTEVVRALLAQGQSDVDARWGSWGLTALHQACFYHHAGIVALLLRHYADPRVVDRKGRRPLHVAKGEAQPEIAAMLEEALAEPQRALLLARARLLADAAHAAAAGIPLTELPSTPQPGYNDSNGNGNGTTTGVPALAARIAQGRAEVGLPPPVVVVSSLGGDASAADKMEIDMEEKEDETVMGPKMTTTTDVVAGVVDAVVGSMAPDVFHELLDMMAMQWDPARRRRGRGPGQQRGKRRRQRRGGEGV